MPKRKASATSHKHSKRRKHSERLASGDLWEAEGIQDERRTHGKLQYLVRWKGRDPVTGRDYEPTWEPVANCTKALIESWHQEHPPAARPDSSTGKTPSKTPTEKPRPSRQARVVLSSPEPSTAHTASALSQPSTPAVPDTLPFASSALTTPVDASTPTKRPSPRIYVDRDDSFDPSEYERFSQLPPTQPASTEAHTQDTDPESPQPSVPGPEYQLSGIVPDSQSSAGEGSFVPATQQTTGTTQESSTAHESQEEATEDSGLLEIVQQAASRAPSPARSIPETIYDTSAESQTQRRPTGAEDPIDVSDTSEVIDDSSELVTQPDRSDNSQGAQPQSAEVPTAEEEGQQQDEAIASTDQAVSAQVGASPPQDETSRVEVEETEQESETPKEQREPLSAARQEGQQQHEAPPSEESALPSASSAGALQPLEVSALQSIEEQQQQEGQTSSRSLPPSESVPDTTVDAVDETLQLLDSRLSASLLVLVPVVEQPEPTGGVQATHPTGDVQPAASQDSVGASLAEHLVPAQFPFHSQHSLHNTSDTAQASAGPRVCEEPESPLVISTPVITVDSSLHTERREVIPIETSADSPVQAPTSSSQNAPQTSPSADALLVSSTQAEDKRLIEEHLESGYTRSQPLALAQHLVIEPVRSTCASHTIVEEAIDRRDFAFDSQTPVSTNQSALSREQNAQIVPSTNDLSTQEDAPESIRPSVEELDTEGYSTPDSRHDSSQDSPERRLYPSGHSSSPIAHPPSYSPGTVDSNVPPRPKTPILTSSLFTMSTQDSGKQFKQLLDKKIAQQQAQNSLAQRQAENSFTPIRRGRRSNTAATPAETLLRAGAPQSITATEGTRSPSTVPDRVPAPPAPTSLRTVALTQASHATVEELQQDDKGTVLNVDDPAEAPPMVPAIVTTGPTIPETLSSDNEELSDATDDDAVSLLNDDLQLATEEYVVPLFVEGRQCDEYSAHIRKHNKILMPFMKDPQNAKGLAEMEELLSYLRAIETHFDLVYQEADLAGGDDMDAPTQIAFAFQFGIENSIKFKFLHALFHELRQEEKHIVLVTQDDDNRLYNIIETFCKAISMQYSMPMRGLQADPARVKGNLSITIFPSTASPIIRPADVIICLDGVQDATQIRQKNWAINLDMDVVPVLHLVISRTVGHIERYLSSSLEKRERVHTILASLTSMINELGKPIDEDMLRAPTAAAHVAAWVLSAEQERGEWPLGSIGSVKNVIEYQTQLSPAPERVKRPHDDEDFDPAKRMRLTPQPHDNQTSSNTTNIDNEVTRVSDSMPGTAIDNTQTLRAQLVQMQEAFVKERSLREAEQARFREQEATWSKQQTVYEDLSREYRLLLSSKQELEETIGTISKNNSNLRERLAALKTDMHALTNQLADQRNTHLLSEDAKIVEITRLRTEAAEANAERERASRNAKTAQLTLDYTNDQYRAAQDAATQSAATVAELEARVTKLDHAASGEQAKMKSMHLGTQYKSLATQNKSLKSENNILKLTLKNKEEELARAKLSGRMGVGTRGSSVTPQPTKTRSRAASPLRPSNLRNG